jgi:hypothetical protein
MIHDVLAMLSICRYAEKYGITAAKGYTLYSVMATEMYE